MTFQELLTSLYDDLNYQPAPSPATTERLKRWVNEGHRYILRAPGMTGLRKGTVTFSSVASQSVYGLSQLFDKLPDAIVYTDGDQRLQYRTMDWLRTVDPGDDQSGTPYIWTDIGLTPLLRQPAAAGSGIWAVSTSSGDTTQYVNIHGALASGDMIASTSTLLTGTSRVALGTATTYTAVVSWGLSSICAGDISLYDAAASGNLLARIPAGQTSVQYQGLRLWPTPSAALDYRVDGQFRIVDLVNSTDVPMLPESYHDLVATYVRAREYQKQGDGPRYGSTMQDFQTALRQLRSYVEYPADYVAIPGRLGAGRVGWTDLGPGYPADWVSE